MTISRRMAWAKPLAQEEGAPPPKGDWHARVPVALGGSIIGGIAVVAAFVLGFGIWAATAPLDGAVMAQGVIAASGQNQVIDHLEGGVIKTIHVREGARVRAGDVLVELDGTGPEAERNRVLTALIGVEAQIVRAEAERDGLAAIEFPMELRVRASERGLTPDLEQQRAEFRNRLERHQSELAVIAERVSAAREEITGLSTQLDAEQRKLTITREELKEKEKLLERGLTPRTTVVQLRLAEADSLGRIGAIQAGIAQKEAAIAELAQQRVGSEATRREQAAARINELRPQVSDLREQLASRLDVVARSQIRAPADGVIVKLEKNTTGSVIRPGEPVLSLLPTGSDLLIDARLSPIDKDAVAIDQAATLRFSALNQRRTPDVAGRVTYVSADALQDERTGEPYFIARLRIDGELPTEIPAESIYAGMPVEAFIQTGARTFLEYLAQPVVDSFSKAFREE